MSAPARAWARLSATSSSRVAIVVDLLANDDTALSMIGVLAEAHVGDDGQIRQRLFERTHRALHDAIGRVPARTHGVLVLRNPKQNHRWNAEVVDLATLLDQAVDRQLRDPGHGPDRLTYTRAGHDEERQDQPVHGRARLRYETAHGRSTTKAPRPVHGEAHRATGR